MSTTSDNSTALQREVERLERENEQLRAQLEESQETLRAIREGEVDALVVSGPQGDRVFTLQSAEQPYRLLIEQMREGAVMLVRDGAIHYANAAFADMVGRPLEQVIGSAMQQYVAPPDRPLFDALLHQTQSGTARGEVSLCAADSRFLPVYLGLSTVVVNGVSSICLVATDLTEQKHTEQVLASEQFIRRLIDNAPIGVAVVDRNLRYLLANSAYAAIADGGSLVGRTVAEVFSPAVAQIVEPRVREVFERGEPSKYEEFETPIRGRTWWTVTQIPLRDAEGKTEAVLILTEDVTERKVAEEALQRSLEQISLLINNLPGYAFFKDANLRYVMLNHRACQLLGRPLEEIVGKDDFELFPAQYAEKYSRDDRRVLESGEPLLDENEVNEENGRPVILSTRKVPIKDGSGKVTGLIGLSIDITERKRAEEALRASQHLLRLITNAVPALIAYIDADGRYRMANNAYLGWMRADPATMIGRHVSEFIDPAAWRTAGPYVDRALAGEPVVYEAEMAYGNAPPRWVHATYTPDRDEQGQVRGFVVLATDITERKHAEEYRRQQQQDLDRAQAIAHSGSWRIDFPRNTLAWSDELYRILGVPKDTPLSYQTFLQAVHPDDRRHVDTQWNAALQGQPYDLEHRIIAHGQTKWVHNRAYLEFDHAGNPLSAFGITQDITERKQTEQNLAAAKLSAEQARAAAEHANKAKDHFLAVLSHELRNPLNPVLATAWMLRDDPRFDADTREQLEVICRNVELEARLIDDLLDVTRIERGKVVLDRGHIDLRTVIQRAVEVCWPDIEARQLRFSIDMPDGPYVVDGDAARLQQVFWNLLKNAIKFTPNGGSVGIRCYRDEGSGVRGQGPVFPPLTPDPCPLSPCVVVEVTDSGVGMEPAALGRIFNAFEQAERSITREFGGLGLGLTISKAMVEMHAGHIAAQSLGKGQGATFTVRLPLLPEQAGVSATPPTDQAPPPNVAIRQLRILLVEDHGDTARIMRRLLSADGHAVEHAADVASALKLAGEQTFDLMLSDLGLPDGSGLDLMRALRAKGITVPGIALSGYGQERYSAEPRGRLRRPLNQAGESPEIGGGHGQDCGRRHPHCRGGASRPAVVGFLSRPRE